MSRLHSEPCLAHTKRDLRGCEHCRLAYYYARHEAQQERRDYQIFKQRERLGMPAPTRPMPAACELCGKAPTSSKGRRLHLDHDHTTGAFRGWLCQCCNTSLGKLGDNADGLRRALAYLERTR